MSINLNDTFGYKYYTFIGINLFSNLAGNSIGILFGFLSNNPIVSVDLAVVSKYFNILEYFLCFNCPVRSSC